jgi:D-3-phosphoglycerate dehydrogenase
VAQKVLLPQDILAEGKEYLTGRGYEIVHGSGQGEADMARDVAGCDALISRTLPVSAAVLRAGERLKIVAKHGVGYDNIDVEAAAALGIQVTNAPESNSRSVAEFTMNLVLSCAKKTILLRDALLRGDFAFKAKNMGFDVAGKTLGVVGFGRIGSLVAKMAAQGFEMRVLAFDPFCPAEKFPAYVARAAGLDALLEEADIVTLHMPITPDTAGMMGKAQFEKMKRTAWLVNCARGEVVREAELAEAAASGLIAGAAVDVYAAEPPPANHPLLSLPNVIATPHMASNTGESMVNMAVHAAMEVHRCLSGEPVQWPVNRPVTKR